MSYTPLQENICLCVPINPAIRLHKEVMTVTKITRQVTGGMAGGSKTYYGRTLSENDNFITFFDVIADEKIRIGVIGIQEIKLNTTIAQQVFDTTNHANIDGKKVVSAKHLIEWFEVPKNTDITFSETFGMGINSKLTRILTLVMQNPV
jgi:hypothetical protein